MDEILTYRGKTVTRKDVSFIRTLIKENPGDSQPVFIAEALLGMGVETTQWGFG